MAHQIIAQPDGKYALWSTVVDDFILIDATPDDIADELIAQESRRIRNGVIRIISKLDRGEPPYYQFTRTFDECLERIREIHGNDAESLKLLGQTHSKG